MEHIPQEPVAITRAKHIAGGIMAASIIAPVATTVISYGIAEGIRHTVNVSAERELADGMERGVPDVVLAELGLGAVATSLSLVYAYSLGVGRQSYDRAEK